MDYKEELLKCSDAHVAERMINSIARLFDKDGYLLKANVHERTIASALAFHMREQFDEWDVDPEYNKLGDDPKRVPDEHKLIGVIPDIIVHKRGNKLGQNKLIIEIKCAKRGKTARDIRKLRLMREGLHYQQALFLRFGVKDRTGELTHVEWV